MEQEDVTVNEDVAVNNVEPASRPVKAASPRLIGISSPKTWDQWIKKSPSLNSSVEVDDDDKKDDVVVVKRDSDGECSVKLVTSPNGHVPTERKSSAETSDDKNVSGDTTPQNEIAKEAPADSLDAGTPKSAGDDCPKLDGESMKSTDDQKSVDGDAKTEDTSSLNTIIEEDGDEPNAEWTRRVLASGRSDVGSVGSSKNVRIKLDDDKNPNKVIIKSTRFQVIPAVDVWEPKGDEEMICVGDPMTMIESHLNQLTMVESQLKKLGKDAEAMKMKPLKLDLDDNDKSKKKSDKKLGWLSIFKKKPPTPTEPVAPTVKKSATISGGVAAAGGPQTVRSQRAQSSAVQKTRKAGPRAQQQPQHPPILSVPGQHTRIITQ
ncbi:unnamed protein product, partial [Nesidiocoris tenuis]